MSAPRGIRQTMSDLHIWVGLLAGWILYAMFLTGTVSYFRDEISAYTRPELPAAQVLPDAAQTSARMLTQIVAAHPQASAVTLTLPTARNPVLSAMWRDPQAKGRHGMDSGLFDPSSGVPPVSYTHLDVYKRQSADWALSPGQLSPVLVAALAGLAIGAFACGPMADRFGRKRILMLSVLFFGGFSLLSAFSSSVTERCV